MQAGRRETQSSQGALPSQRYWYAGDETETGQTTETGRERERERERKSTMNLRC